MSRKKTGFSQKTYYQQRKDEIAAARKQRYLTDPEYREKIIERSKKDHVMKKGVQETERVESNKFRINGVMFYTVNFMAAACGVTTSLFNYYHDMGYIPKPKKVGDYKWRMYRQEFVDAIIPIVKDYLSRKIATPKEMGELFLKSLDEEIIKEIIDV